MMLKPTEWLRILQSLSSGTTRAFYNIYGFNYSGIDSKRDTLVAMLKAYLLAYGDDQVIISRAPGRVNIMGRHIDHQGGYGNMIAIDKDMYCIIGIRSDNMVCLKNLDSERFPERRFSIPNTLRAFCGNWLDFVNGENVQALIKNSRGEWSHYLMAAVARFQAKFSDRFLKGMNVLVSGDIPIAAGLSSSTALLVALAEGIVYINELDVSPKEFAELCATAEWYVGTRGWAGDHAAMKFSKRGHVVQLDYYPIHIKNSVKFPDACNIVICNSQIKARKTAEAKEIFNHRIACYFIGRELFRRRFPEFAPEINYLRDINTKNLKISLPRLLEMLKKLPLAMDRAEIMSALTSEQIDEIPFDKWDAFKIYPIRPIVLFGLAEIERSLSTIELIRRNSIETLGELMCISHDGDRVVRNANDNNGIPFVLDYSDSTMDQLISKAKQAPDSIQMAYLPGAYRCSIAEIDKMIDISLAVSGVMGAQIAGAGLGGCIVVLVQKENVGELKRELIEHYFEPANLEPDIFVCHLTAGSGLLDLAIK